VTPEGAERAAGEPVRPAGEPVYVAGEPVHVAGEPATETVGAPVWVPEQAVAGAEASFVADAVTVQAALEWVTATRAQPPTASFEPPRRPENLWPPLPPAGGGAPSAAAVAPPAADHAHLARLAREQEGR
jgi:hypothetical protein